MKASKVIGVLNPKGGTGKSTTTTNLARYFQLQGLKVLLGDMDAGQTETLKKWFNAQDKIPLPDNVGLTTPANVASVINIKMKTDYDIIILDGAANSPELDVQAIKVCDLILISLKPSDADVWGCEQLVDLIKARQEIGAPLAAYLFINGQKKHTRLANEIEDKVKEYGLPVLSSRFTYAVAYMEALGQGLSVLDIENNFSNEVMALGEEITAILNLRRDEKNG